MHGSTSRGRSTASSLLWASIAARSATWMPSPRIRSWAAEEGESIGAGAAEALRVIVIDDDEDESKGQRPSALVEQDRPDPPPLVPDVR